MSGILCHIFDCMPLDPRSGGTDSLFGQGFWWFEYKFDVQRLRELDGHGIPQEADRTGRNKFE